MVLDPNMLDEEDPWLAWARAQQLAAAQATTPADLGTLAPPATNATGRKGGSTSGPGRTQQIGPALSPDGNELPLQVTPLPDSDPMADTDPRGDMTPQELAAFGSPKAPIVPDAISGAAPAAGVADRVALSTEAPQAAEQAPAPSDAGFYDWARGHAAEQPLPSMQENDLHKSAQAEIDAIQKMTPQEYLAFQADRAGHMQQLQAQRQGEAQAESDRRAREDLAMQQAAIAKANADTADLMARAAELANTKITPKTAGLGDVIGILLGGMFSGGGPNMALAQFNRKVDADLEAQKANLANGFRGLEMKRGAIGDELARHGDLYRAQETYRVAAYESAINRMQTELQQYDPAGSTAMMLRNGLDQFHAAQAKAIADFNKQQLDDAYKQAQTLQALAAAQKTQQETIGLKAKQAAAGAGPTPAKVLPVEYYKSLGLLAPPEPMSADAYKAWLTLGKSGAETSKAQQDAQSNDAATTISMPHGDFAPIVDKTGKPVRIAADVAKELNEQNASAQNVVSDLNDVKRMLEEDPSLVDRKTWAEIQARIGQTLPAIAGFYKSKFSSREEEAIKDITNLDFDSYVRRLKDKGTAIASIGAIVDTVKRSVDTTNSATLHTPVNGMLSDLGSAPKPKPTEVDLLMSKLSTSPHEDDVAGAKEPPRDPGFAAALAQQRDINRPKPAGPGRKDQDQLLDRAAAFATSHVAPLKGRWYLVDDAGKEIKGVPPVETEAEGAALLRKYRDAARAGLAKLSADAEDKTVRERAGAIVQLISAPDEDAP